MSSQDIKQLIRRFEYAMNTRQLDQLDQLITSDFVRHCEATPWTDVRSLEEFKEFLKLDAAVFPDNVQTFEKILVDGDMAAIWASYEGTQTGQMGPLPPSGKRAKFAFSGVLHMERGKIAEWWVTWDNSRFSPSWVMCPDLAHERTLAAGRLLAGFAGAIAWTCALL